MSKHTGKGKEHIEQAGRVGWRRDESGINWKPCLRSKRHVTENYNVALVGSSSVEKKGTL